MIAYPPEILKKRQKLIFEKLPLNSVAILYSGKTKTKNNDVEYKFRPSSNVLYLTGLTEPDIIVVISTKTLKDGQENKITVFRRKLKFEEAVWIGSSVPDDAIKQICDEIDDIENFENKITKIIENTEFLFYDIGENDFVERSILSSFSQLKRKPRGGSLPPKKICDVNMIIGEMRAKKDEYEIELIKKAVKITKMTLERIKIKPGMMEYEIEAEISKFYRSFGGGEAFPTIVASGKNSVILHYSKNSSPVGIPCIIDTGAEINFYASDITRTFIPRDFSTDSKSREKIKLAEEIKLKVQEIQKKVIENVREGISFDDLNTISQKLISEALFEFGILKENPEKIFELKLFKPFFPHKIGHHLGLDVHDMCPYYEYHGVPKKLEDGNVITIEPGIYFPDRDSVYVKGERISDKPEDETWYEIKIPEIFKGIGVRIEDDILVRKNGFEIL